MLDRETVRSYSFGDVYAKLGRPESVWVSERAGVFPERESIVGWVVVKLRCIASRCHGDRSRPDAGRYRAGETRGGLPLNTPSIFSQTSPSPS